MKRSGEVQDASAGSAALTRLQSQIKSSLLFNTLNSVSSLSALILTRA